MFKSVGRAKLQNLGELTSLMGKYFREVSEFIAYAEKAFDALGLDVGHNH